MGPGQHGDLRNRDALLSETVDPLDNLTSDVVDLHLGVERVHGDHWYAERWPYRAHTVRVRTRQRPSGADDLRRRAMIVEHHLGLQILGKTCYQLLPIRPPKAVDGLRRRSQKDELP